MKIGAIGFYTNFNHNNIENIKYSNEQTILEYDMLIINVNNIYEEYEMVGNYQGIPSLTHQSSRNIRGDIDRRKKEFEAYLNSGRFIIVITPYSDKRTIYTGKQEVSGTGRSARITNIVDFIDTEKFSPVGFNTIEQQERISNLSIKMQKKYLINILIVLNIIVLQIKNMYKILLRKLQELMKLFFGMKMLIMG